MSRACDRELPRERIITYGSERVTTIELLAALLGTGTRQRPVMEAADYLLDSVGGLSQLAHASPHELMTLDGIGLARATRITAAFQLGRRALEEGPPLEALKCSPALIYARLGPRMRTLMQEVFTVLTLSCRNTITNEIEVARGSVDSVEVHPREVFRVLTRYAATAGIVVHNHPSGSPEPSRSDVSLTHRLRAVGDIVGIPILDHIIIARNGFVSMNEYLRER